MKTLLFPGKNGNSHFGRRKRVAQNIAENLKTIPRKIICVSLRK